MKWQVKRLPPRPLGECQIQGRVFLRREVLALIGKDRKTIPNNFKNETLTFDQKQWMMLGVSERNQTLCTMHSVKLQVCPDVAIEMIPCSVPW
jgi:hypothetical protein